MTVPMPEPTYEPEQAFEFSYEEVVPLRRSERGAALTPSEVPQSREAEEAVIGAVFINAEVYFDLAQFLLPEDFHIHRLRFVWDAFVNLSLRRAPIDLLTVSEELERVGKLSEIGGSAYLTSLINQVPSSLNAEYYGRIVEEKSIQRKMINHANQVAQLGYDNTLGMDARLAKFDALVDAGQRNTSPKVNTAVTAYAAADTVRAMIGNPGNMAIQSLIPALDRAFGGFTKDEVFTLVGDSSIGKSTLFQQIGEQIARLQRRTLYFQYESSEAAMVMKRVFANANVPIKKLRGNTLTAAEKATLENQLDAYQVLQQDGFLMFDTQARNISQIRRSVRANQPDLVVVDNLAEMEIEKSYGNRTQDLLLNMTALKRMTHDFHPATVVIHNINAEESSNLWPGANQNINSGKRKKKATVNAPPNINSVAWAKDIKNKTDILAFLIPDIAADLSADVVPLCLWIMKDRSGDRLTLINLWFDRKGQWFYDFKP